MTTTEIIIQRLSALPEAKRREVLDFVEFLGARGGADGVREEDEAWGNFSLAAAMRGMEGDDSPYRLADLKESFR